MAALSEDVEELDVEENNAAIRALERELRAIERAQALALYEKKAVAERVVEESVEQNVGKVETEAGGKGPTEGDGGGDGEELASFNDVAYWNGFYDPEQGGDTEEFDWYSTEEWLSECVTSIAAELPASIAGRSLDLLDVGVGTCPLIFELARMVVNSYGDACDGGGGGGGSSGGSGGVRWGNLVGVDFVESAMEAMNARALEEFGSIGSGDEAPSIHFHAADARDMSPALGSSASFDVVFDKGCLDCFVSGDGEGDISRYLREVARVLRERDGRALFVSVNGADVVEMLRSQGRNLREDSHCIQPAAGNPSAAARAKWRAKKQQSAATQKGDDGPGGEGRRERGRVLELLAIYAYEQKHCYVCRSVDPSVSGTECASGSPQSKGTITIHCGVCRSRSWAYPDFPAECPQCANKLQRFALS